MASFSVEDFVGNGSLKELLPKLLDDGWDDVPSLKLMNAEDMDSLSMTPQQKDSLEIRKYLHDRVLMQYSDKLEASRRPLPELLALSSGDLSTQFGMKRGHIARFTNRATSCATTDPLPSSFTLPSRRIRDNTGPSRKNSLISNNSMQSQSMGKSSKNDSSTIEQSIADLRTNEGHIFKGIVSSGPAESRACGCVPPPPVVDEVAPYSFMENISVQKLTPEYKIGIEKLVKTKAPPMKASELWRDQPALFLCIRRPGCIMCRAESHQLYARKPIFDALGIQLFVVLHEHIEAEVKDFWPRYWGGAVLYDKGMGFFKALGGGNVLKEKFISGFLFNSRARANYKRAKAVGVEQNFNGEGEIKGGIFIMGRGRSGVAYQFIERNFGDWAPHSEIIEICTRLQQNQPLN